VGFFYLYQNGYENTNIQICQNGYENATPLLFIDITGYLSLRRKKIHSSIQVPDYLINLVKYRIWVDIYQSNFDKSHLKVCKVSPDITGKN
jgi:hypothetical protein